jgi:hypothetical protein
MSFGVEAGEHITQLKQAGGLSICTIKRRDENIAELRGKKANANNAFINCLERHNISKALIPNIKNPSTYYLIGMK